MIICWDNLEKLRYSKKTGKWYRGRNKYMEMDYCKTCNEPYLTNIHKPGDFCDRRCSGKFKIKDLKGKRFGKYTVLKQSESKDNRSVWLCRCDCGKIKNVIGRELTNGKIKSCGCYRKEKLIINLKGKKFGRLKVLKYLDGGKWLCKCDCGKIIKTRSHYLKNEQKSCGCLSKEISSEIHSGENHWNYKGGVVKKNIPFYDTYAHQINWCEEVRRNPEDDDILQVKCKKCNKWHTPKMTDVVERIRSINGNVKKNKENNLYCSDKCKKSCPIFNKKLYQVGHPKSEENERPYQKEWSKMVIEQDNYECQGCGSKENLIAHHILPVKPYPLFQADVDNGICFCGKCHYKHGHKDECSTGELAQLVC